MRNSQTFNIHYKVNFDYFIKKLYKKQTINSEPWKNFKYEIFSGLYFPKFSPKQEDTDQKKTPYLDTFHAVKNETSNEFFFQYIVSLMPLYMYVALSLQQ